MIRFHSLRSLSLTLFLLAQGCQSSPKPEAGTGTETNWLKTCTADAECGSLACECGVCTITCDTESDCEMSGAECRVPSAELSAGCGGTAARLCLEPETTSDDVTDPTSADSADDSSDGESDSNAPLPSDDQTTETTVPPIDDSGSSSPNGTGADSDPETSEASPTEVVGSDGGTTPTGSPSDGAPDAGEPSTETSDGSGDETSAATPDLDAATPAPITDSSTPSETENPLCVLDASRDWDLCNPERCDQIGEACCDPYPGDGPNYCGPGLVCRANGCEPEETTTTPEALERQACEDTGGTWDYESCGHYRCGLPPDCDAIIPGCNCGEGMSFGELGCEPDANCTSTQ